MVSLQDVAQAVDVSVATISAVLSDKGWRVGIFHTET